MLPDKLPTNKYVVELEPAGDGADDLTGDAGAVGRMIVSGEGLCCPKAAVALRPSQDPS